MRNPGLVVALVLLALIPIAVWGYCAYGLAISYDAAQRGAPKAGQAAAILLLVVLALTPSFIGGILMLVGAGLLGRKPVGARITASIGIVLLVATAVVVLAFEGSATHYSMYIAAAVYIVAHCGLMAWLWRS